MSFEDDTRKVTRTLLDEVLTKGIQRNEEQCKIWMSYKKGHEKVAEALQTFQKDLHINCDGYFAKYSAAGAVALCERRIERSEEMLKHLNKERDLYETRIMLSENDLLDDSSGREFVEHWNEYQVTEWKKKHREMVRKYHQKLAKLRQEEKQKIETDEDLFKRLDQLEIEEELADELNRLQEEEYEYFEEELDEEEEEYSDESEESSESVEEEELCKSEEFFESVKEEKKDDSKKEDVSGFKKEQFEDVVQTCQIKKSVSFALPEDILKNQEENSAKEEKGSSETTENSEGILRIEFTHSENNPVVMSDGDSIETPADICRIFSRPKSILKRSPNDLTPEQAPPPEYSTEEEEEEEEIIKPSTYEIVVKDIVEKSVTVIASDSTENKEASEDIRPVSKFKRDRQMKKI
ncbi:hypothetical protein ANTPLA_LOCUS9736 [Anthophora plagiata]